MVSVVSGMIGVGGINLCPWVDEGVPGGSLLCT